MCGFNPDFRLVHSTIRELSHTLQNNVKDLQVHLPDKAGTAHCYTTKGCSCKVAKFSDMQLFPGLLVLLKKVRLSQQDLILAVERFWRVFMFQRFPGAQDSSMLLLSYNLHTSCAGHWLQYIQCGIKFVPSTQFAQCSCCSSTAQLGHASVPVMHACWVSCLHVGIHDALQMLVNQCANGVCRVVSYAA